MNNYVDAIHEMNVVLAGSVPATPSVLEAGCGRRSVVDLGDTAIVTGIDIAPEEVQHNKRLQEVRIGDIQNCEIEQDRFDVAVCWNVLEHLDAPGAALANLYSALRPGGVLVLGMPNRQSLKARLVVLTPHRLHSFVWHRLYPNAPLDEGPFSVVHHPEMDLDALRRFAHERNMTIVYRALYESEMQQKLRRRLHLGERVWGSLGSLLGSLSRGQIDALHSDAILVLRKASASAPNV